jgi:tetratricopeptide (TPR) repeat protein
VSGRDFNSLLGVTPGVQRTPGGGFLSVSISGARSTSNNYMIDGISNNDRYYGDSVLNQTGVVGVPATLVPMDAIAEFTVQQTPSAENGVKGGGAVNVVMKSGTNQPHGTAYYFRHDDWTDSPNYFVEKAGGATTPVKNQQYGGTFGGPIQKDKTFFFGYYEGQRLAVTSPYQVQIPKPDVQFSLGSVLARIDRVPDATVCLRRAIALEPRNFRANLLLGRILTLQGQASAAIAFLRTATEVDPRSSEAHTFLADAYEKTGAVEEASKERQRARNPIKP